MPVSLAGKRQQTAFLKARKKFAEPVGRLSERGRENAACIGLVSGVEARPAKDLAVVQSFTAANFGLVCLPTAVAGFTSGFPSERFAAGNIKMGMVPLPALALAAGSFPGLFDHAIRKGHLTPPIPSPSAVGTDARKLKLQIMGPVGVEPAANRLVVLRFIHPPSRIIIF